MEVRHDTHYESWLAVPTRALGPRTNSLPVVCRHRGAGPARLPWSLRPGQVSGPRCLFAVVVEGLEDVDGFGSPQARAYLVGRWALLPLASLATLWVSVTTLFERRAEAAMAGTPDDTQPELLDDRTVELMILGARALAVVVYLVVLVTFAMLALGFFLLLAGASSDASFVEWVYRNTHRAMQPFRGMFPVREVDGQSVFDASLLFAAAFYGFFAIGLHAAVNYLTGLARARHFQAVKHTLSPEQSNDQQPRQQAAYQTQARSASDGDLSRGGQR